MTEVEVIDYVEDSIEAAEKIERFTDGMAYDTFERDEKTVDAVLRNFEVIGEAAKNVPENVRREIELEIVWKTVEADVPSMISQLQRVKNDLENGS